MRENKGRNTLYRTDLITLNSEGMQSAEVWNTNRGKNNSKWPLGSGMLNVFKEIGNLALTSINENAYIIPALLTRVKMLTQKNLTSSEIKQLACIRDY